jgi:hypothetical protein
LAIYAHLADLTVILGTAGHWGPALTVGAAEVVAAVTG